jgi:dGTP triphosphohydrolase
MASYEDYNGSDILKEFFKCSVDPIDIELKSKEMIDKCINIIIKYKLHDGRTKPLRAIKSDYLDLIYVIKNRNDKCNNHNKIFNNFCDKVRNLNEGVREEIITILKENNKLLEEIIYDPKLFLEKNKITQKLKRTSKMTCPTCLKEIFIYTYETTHKGSKKCEYYQTHKNKPQPNDKIKCCELCDYIQSYSNSSRMKKHRLLCEAYQSSVNIEYCQESKENTQELFF